MRLEYEKVSARGLAQSQLGARPHKPFSNHDGGMILSLSQRMGTHDKSKEIKWPLVLLSPASAHLAMARFLDHGVKLGAEDYDGADDEKKHQRADDAAEITVHRRVIGEIGQERRVKNTGPHQAQYHQGRAGQDTPPRQPNIVQQLVQHACIEFYPDLF